MTERGIGRGSVDDALTEGQVLRLQSYRNHIEKKKGKARAEMASIIIIIIIILVIDMIIDLTAIIMHIHRIVPFPLTMRRSGVPINEVCLKTDCGGPIEDGPVLYKKWPAP